MNRTLLALAVMVAALGANVALADDCGPRPTWAPQGRSFNEGQYQLQTTQVWVPGQQQQVFVPGECRHFGRRHHRCSPGSYQLVMTEGHYENRQEWVWVANTWDRRPPRQYGRDWRSGRRHGAVPVGF